eukprot:scaffold3418_cov124-Isochrysis_galbana.AAC.16
MSLPWSDSDFFFRPPAAPDRPIGLYVCHTVWPWRGAWCLASKEPARPRGARRLQPNTASAARAEPSSARRRRRRRSAVGCRPQPQHARARHARGGEGAASLLHCQCGVVEDDGSGGSAGCPDKLTGFCDLQNDEEGRTEERVRGC